MLEIFRTLGEHTEFQLYKLVYTVTKNEMGCLPTRDQGKIEQSPHRPFYRCHDEGEIKYKHTRCEMVEINSLIQRPKIPVMIE
jgi:hypothetical protein